MENIGIIYCLTSPSGKKYIGQCVNFKRRMQRYKCKDCKKQPKIYRAICKYGFENFKIEILEEVEKSLLNEKENFYILKFNTMQLGYNCTTGGDKYEASDETKLKMSLARSGPQNPFYGKKHTDETRKALSEINKNKIGELNTFYGKKHTIETKQKLREYRLGRPLSENCKNKLSIAFSGERNKSAKPYKIVSPLGEVFNIKGTLKKFVLEHNLSIDCIKNFIDKGIIPPPKDLKHNRLSIQRKNSTGWQFSRIV